MPNSTVRFYHAAKSRTRGRAPSLTWPMLLCLFCASRLLAQPAAPTGLTATAVSGSQINLSWNDNASGEDGYIIQRSLTSGSGYVDIDTVDADQTSLSDVGLSENTTYYYTVTAYDINGRSDSNEASATTLLASPSGLDASTVSNTQIDLVWSDQSSLENGFKIELKNGAGGSYVEIATVGANVTNYSSMGLNPSTTYFFRVRAYNGGGNSAYSSEDSATTFPNPPAAPSGLTASAVSNSQINLSWNDNSTNETQFKIERKLTGTASFTLIDSVAAGVSSYQNTGLSASTGYTYRVRAFNAGGNSAYSNQASDTTLINPPAAPSALAATTISNTQINLSWTDNASTETVFKIERKTGAGGVYAQIDSVGANVTNYASTGLAGNIQYYYRVRAANAGGNSAYSNEDNATTLQDPPAAPSSLQATTVSNERIDLAWTDNASNEEGFKVEIKVGAGGTYVVTATLGANTSAYSSTGLDAGTKYYYRVRAFNGTGNSAYTNEDSATTLPEPPAAPNNLTATTASQTQINLGWTDNASNEAGFKIERKPTGSVIYDEIDTVGANVTSYFSTGLTANTGYTFRVRAYNAVGNSAYTSEASDTTLPNPPAAPSGLDAVAVNNNRIDLSWTDNASNESGFRVERRAATDTAFAEITTLGAEVTNYVNNGLSSSTKYFYRVRAYNTGGNSSYSNLDSATTFPDVPAAPTSLAASTVSDTQINLTWSDNANNEDGFKIERKTGAGGAYALIDSVGANVTNYASTGLTSSTEYYYRVRAFNLSGPSSYSNEANATTYPAVPAAPSSLAASPVSAFQINLSWTDNSSTEAVFKIERKGPSDSVFVQIDSVAANSTNYSNGGLEPNTQYSYRVRATNITGASAYSNTANATTLLDPAERPSGLDATGVSNSQINLSWTDNSNNEAGFKIERKITAFPTFTEIATVGANVATYTDTGLASNTSYSYRVRAFNGSGNSGYSNIGRDTTFVDPPSAPTVLSAIAVGSTEIDLAWTDNANNEDGFKVERKAGGDTAFTVIAALGADVTNYASTGLNLSTVYFFRVRAHRMNNSFSNYTNVASDTTFGPLPAIPDSLAATVVSNTQIDLSWLDKSANEDGFKIERKTGAAGAYVEIATTAPNATSYANDTGLNANSKYFYRVRAFNGNGNSAYSNEANGTTFLRGPANLTAMAVSGSQINLAWNDQTNNELGFKIEAKQGALGTFAEIATVGQNVTSYANTGLTSNMEYFYRVRAYNANNVSAYTNEASDTTFHAPGAPDSLSATAMSNTQINLTWRDRSTNELGFKIERKQGGAGSYAEITTVGANVTSYANTTGLIANTKYFYRVRAYNVNGNSAFSDEADALTLMKGPGNLAATAVSSSQINLTWVDQTANEDGFKIERKTGAGGTFAEIGMVAANATNFSSTGLVTNTQYFYRVRAYSATNVSAYTNEANATTFFAPLAPDSLVATPLSNVHINLSWLDKSSNETGFKLERKQGNAGVYAEIATLGPNVTSYGDNLGLVANSKYFYRVRAYNPAGSSDYSNEATATTLLKGPTNLVATTAGNTQINLTWTDQTSNEGGFKIERKTGLAGVYAEIAIVGANVTNCLNTGLASGTQYFYRARAYNATNVSTYSNEDDATTSGAAKRSETDSSAARQEQAAIPAGVTLSPNYPNPFNPATRISYTLSEGTHVRLAIVNVNGQVVAILVNGYQGRGIYQRTFKAADLPSGVYYAVLRAGAITLTQRMLLTK